MVNDNMRNTERDMAANDDMHNTESNTLEITGVSNDATEYTGETELITETENIDNKQNGAYEQYDDDISIKNETPEDIHVTINDMNTIHEMNAGQLHINPDT